MMVTQHIVLDMTPGTKPIVNVSQYDTGARTLVFHLRQNRQAFTPPDGCTGIIHGIKPDSTYFSYAVEIDGDTVVADCTEQMTACVGFAECEVRLSNSEGHVGSANFLLNCEKSPMTGAVISESVIAAAEQLTDRAEQAASSATASATAASASAEAAAESASAASTSETNAAASATAASASAEEAGASATAAAESASSASGSEASARGFAEQAEQSAGEASTSAQGAAQDAQTASDKASEAAASADRASDSAVDSANAANLASGYADTARTQAQAAEGSATNAAGSAAAAQAAAATATQKAGEASDSATAANTAAEQAASSASAASTSAGTASEKATQAGDSATNAALSAMAASGSASDADDYAAQALASEAAAAQSAADIAASAAQIQINADNIAALQIVESTSAADITSIEDGADGVPMKSLKVYIEPVQEGSGDPSPDNIRPISGWDSVETVRTGKNLFDKSSVAVGFIEGSSGNVIANTSYRHSDYIKITPGATYCSTDTGFDGGNYGAFYDINKAYVTGARINSFPGTFTAPATACYIRISIDPAKIDTIQIEKGSTATAYEPYQARTITTDLPSTVYGGTLDVVTGELTVDRVFVGPSEWVKYASSNGYNAYRLSNLPLGKTNSESNNGIMSNMISKFGSFSSASMSENIMQGPRINSSQAFVALADGLSPDGITFSYLVAEPQTYTLTPEEVKTLLKQNNIFSNAGQTAIVYVADPKTYIDNSIADAVASLT